MMNDFQKMAGISALLAGATFIVGFVLIATLLAPIAGDLDPGQHVAFLVDNQAIMYTFNLIIYVAFGVFLVVLSLALYERLKTGSPAMIQTATAFGIIWATLVIASGMVANIGMGVVVALSSSEPAQAATVWLAIDSVRNGLGGGNEIVGGFWILLASWAALRAGGLSRWLNYLGLVISLAGILTVVPALGEIGGIVFGLGSIVWFVWLGLSMLRSSPNTAP
jgi:hypothetical protein